MLYISTRNKADSFTAYRALHEDRTPDGGSFVPLRLPVLEMSQIQALKEKSFGQNIAEILNLFFSARLTGWDVDFCVGRYPVKLVSIKHRVVIAQMWHNPQSRYDHMVHSLYNQICGEDACAVPTQWAKICINIAILFGLYGELSRIGITDMDISVPAGDFSLPVAAWYAREMGLPIGVIICGCNENGSVWDLLHRGEFDTDAALIHTELPELDVCLPACLECLIHSSLGTEETLRYLEACEKKETYSPNAQQLFALNKGMYAAVVGKNRIETIISSMYRTNRYIIDPYTALSYGSLQDYRAVTGESRDTLLLACTNPVLAADKISSAIGISEKELIAQVNTPKE